MNQDIAKIDEKQLSDIDKYVFERDYLFQKPILLTNIFKENLYFSKWSFQYLLNKIGDKIVRVIYSDDAYFTLNGQTGSFDQQSSMTFKAYYEKLKLNQQRLYMPQISITEYLVELQQDINFSKYIPIEDFTDVNLWVGPGGNMTGLHYDKGNNFFIQLVGEKKFWLCSPKEFNNLYPNSFYSKAPHMSLVDLATLDYERYPKLKNVRIFEVIIQAGSILYIPSFWWHQVYSITQSMSINMWWKPSILQLFSLGNFHIVLNRLTNFLRDNKKS